MTRRRALVVLAAVLVCGTALPAAGHEEVPGVASVLDAVEPALPAGVTVQVRVSAADQLLVENRTPTELTVLGESGEPFLRIGPQGVLANLLSPAWHLSNDPEGAQVPPEADPAKPPRWGRVSRDPSWGWFDHRLHRARLAIAPAARPGEVVRLEEWTVPYRYGATSGAFRGHREYAPPAGAFEARVLSAPDGMTATVLPGPVPGLLVQAQRPVVVLGAEGEPFVRFTATGAEANEASPTWALTVRAKTGRVPAGELGARLPARWAVQAGQPSLLWLEPRAAYGADAPAADREVKRWEVPLEGGGVVRGETRWVPLAAAPAREPDRSVLPYVLGAAVVLVVGTALVLRRRA